MKLKGVAVVGSISVLIGATTIYLLPAINHFPERSLFTLAPGKNKRQTVFTHRGWISYLTGDVMRMDFYDVPNGHRKKFDVALRELSPKLKGLGWNYRGMPIPGVSMWSNGTRLLFLESGERTSSVGVWGASEPGYLASVEMHDRSTSIGERTRYLWANRGP